MQFWTALIIAFTAPVVSAQEDSVAEPPSAVEKQPPGRLPTALPTSLGPAPVAGKPGAAAVIAPSNTEPEGCKDQTAAERKKDPKHGYVGILAPVLPTLQISGSTDGTADLKVGLDATWGLFGFEKCWNITLSPLIKTSTDKGIENLLTFSDNKPGVSNPWSTGMSVSFTKIGAVPKRNTKAELAAARAAYDKCLADCGTPQAENGFCTAYGSNPRPKKWITFDVTTLCEVGTTAYNEALGETDKDDSERTMRNAAARFPEFDISFGALAGISQVKYLAPQNGAMVLYKDTSEVAPTASFAFALTWVQIANRYSNTIELPVTLDYRYDPQDTTASWCAPQGMVQRNDTSGMSDAAQACTERSLGSPDKNLRLTASLLGGIVEKTRGFWRGSVGPYVKYRSSDNDVRVGLQAPVYFDFLALAKDDLDYKGVIRVAPSVGAEHGPKGWGVDVTLSVQVLGKRTFFLRALDWL